MIHFELGIRYLSQLRRTRSNDMGRLESTIVAALRDSGARVRREGDALYAAFDEGAIGFWLDLSIALESVAAALALVERDLLGRACFIGALEPPTEAREARLRSLSSRPNRTGLWCDAIVADALDAYARFRPEGELHVLESFTFRETVPRSRSGYLVRPRIAEAVRRAGLDPSAPPVVLVGPGLVGKRQTLDSVLASYGGAVRALRVRFDERSGSIATIADALAPFPAGQSEIAASASANRFSLEPAPALLDAFARCFAGALKALIDDVGSGAAPVLVLEEIDKADVNARECLRRCFAEPGILGRLALFATASDADSLPALVGIGCRALPVAYPDSAESASLLPETAEPAILSEDGGPGGLPAAYRAALGWSQRPDGRPRTIHPRLPADLLEIAYALALAHGSFPLGELVSILFPDGKPHVSLPLALARLADLGVLAAADDPRPAVPDFLAFSESVLGRRVDTVQALVRDRVLAAVSKGRLRKSFETLERFSALGGSADDDLVLESLVNGALRGERRAVQRAIESGGFPGIVGRTRAASLERLFRSRSALVFGTESEIRAAFSTPPESFPSERYRAYDSMDAASLHFACARIDQTLPLAASAVKEALLILQSLPPSGALARAYRLLGEIELSRERIAEAMDYFSFAAESADRCGDVYESLLADVNGAATQFLFGNYSKAERCALTAIKKARSSYQVDWERWSRFMVGRVQFETGRYAAAVETFAEVVGALDPEGGPKKTLAEAWLNRAGAFASESYSAASAPSADAAARVGDSVLFAVEAAYLAEDYDAAVQLSDAFLALPVEPRFRSPERVDWSSGYAMVEDRSVGNASGDSVVRRLVRAYRALSLASGPDPREAVAELHRLSKEERVSDFDPYDAFYFRALSIANAAAGLPAIDRQTILSIAFKRLQRRASRIDDAEVRRSYQFSNRWNATLYADAQANKLI
jgi:tetratricopeptide (TPR) repeat protein